MKMRSKPWVAVLLATALLPQRAASAGKDTCAASVTAPTAPACAKPKMRYWLPLHLMDPVAVQEDVARIASAGFGGVEINAVPHDQPIGAAQRFGGPQWHAVMRAALAQARKSGISVDMAIGPFYPAAVPMGDVGDGAAREMVFTALTLRGRHVSSALPVPDGGAARLIGVSALRISATDGPAATAERAKTFDLTDQVQANAVTWSAPDDGEWRIVASWSREVGHRITGAGPEPFFVVDHFSLAGTNKVIAMWRDSLLPQFGPDRAALRDVFEDSLHLQGYSLWTDDFLAEFKRRRGYDLRPYLPVLSIGHLNDFFYTIFNRRDVTPRSKPDYDFSDGSGAAIRDDYYQTLTELYQERHLAPLRRFFATQGLTLRAQPSYGQSLEGTGPVAEVDVPETESFQLDDLVEAYRVQAGAAHVLGKPVYSAECCATPGAAGQTNWHDAMRHINGLLAGGVNQIVLHGYAQTTPHNAGKPGWMPFGGAFSENYGTLPVWTQAPAFTSILSRQQAILRSGKPDIDIAILRNSYWDNGHAKASPGFDYWQDNGLGQAGYTHDYVSPALLATSHWAVRRGLAVPQGPAYQAMVVMPDQALPPATVDVLQATANAGLPVVFVGKPPKPLGLNQDNATFVRRLARLMASPGVMAVQNAGDVPAALASLGLAPRIAKQQPSDVKMVVRRIPHGRYVWLHNPGPVAVQQTLLTRSHAVAEINLTRGGKDVADKGKPLGPRSWSFTLLPDETKVFRLSD